MQRQNCRTIYPWSIADFSSDVFPAQSSLGKPLIEIIAQVISTIMATFVGYSLLKFNW